MTSRELRDALARLGVLWWRDGQRIVYQPSPQLTPELLDVMKTHREALLRDQESPSLAPQKITHTQGLRSAEVPEAAQIRNLLFHLYPLRGKTWQWHVEMLKRLATCEAFNGRRVLAVVLDEHTEDAAVVRAKTADLFDDILELPNSPELREVVTFEPLFERVRSTDPRAATLYAHGKGVYRVGVEHNQTVLRWAEVLYETCLGGWQHAQTLLRTHPVVGPFVKIGRGWTDDLSLSDWHFSSSWFWFRNRDVFVRPDWREIDRFWSGIEAWPSLHFSQEQAGRLFFEGTHPETNLYAPEFWNARVEPAYADWKEERQPVPEGLKVEIGGGQHPRGEGFIDVDRSTGIDLECDRLPFEDDTVAEVYSSHTFEHVRNLHHLLHEVVRICKVGGRVELKVPHWLSPMALCHDHKQVIPPEQVEHWTKTALGYWWEGCTKRLRHVRTEQVPSGRFAEAKRLYPHFTDEQLMTWVPGAAHEVRYRFRVIPHDI